MKYEYIIIEIHDGNSPVLNTHGFFNTPEEAFTEMRSMEKEFPLSEFHVEIMESDE